MNTHFAESEDKVFRAYNCMPYCLRMWDCGSVHKIANSSTFNVNVRIFVGYGLFSIWSALTYTLLTHDYFLDGHDCQ